MFHHQRDASKVALVGLVERMGAGGAGLLDVQWTTPHLESLGAIDVDRADYLLILGEVLRRPLPPVFARTVSPPP
jgi:leucyl/phenylalanyl-tRNA--protein transferase